jgi:hypothetical protein
MAGHDFLLSPGVAARPPARFDAIDRLQWIYPDIPQDYLDLLAGANGLEGTIGSGYVALTACEAIWKDNDDLGVSEYAPGFVVFGSDGAGELFAFDARAIPWSYGRLPLVGLSAESFVSMGESLDEFFQRVADP